MISFSNATKFVLFQILVNTLIAQQQITGNISKTSNTLYFFYNIGESIYINGPNFEALFSANDYFYRNTSTQNVYWDGIGPCFGYLSGEFFCIGETSSVTFIQSLNPATFTTNTILSFSGAYSGYNLYSNYLLIYMNSQLTNITIYSMPSVTLFCDVAILDSNTYSSAVTVGNSVYLAPGNCTDGSCIFGIYECDSLTFTPIDINYETLAMDYFQPELFIFTSQGTNVTVVFTFYYNTTLLTNVGSGYFILNQGSTNIKLLGPFTFLEQVNMSNIVIVDLNSNFIQYTFNFSSQTFIQVGSSYFFPALTGVAVNFGLSSANNLNSALLTSNWFESQWTAHVDLDTMQPTSVDSLYSCYEYSNTSCLIVGNSQTFNNVWGIYTGQVLEFMTLPQNYYISFRYYSFYFPLVYAVLYSTAISGCNLMQFNRDDESIVSIPISFCVFDENSLLVAATQEDNTFYATIYDSGNLNFYNSLTGLSFSLESSITKSPEPIVYYDTSDLLVLSDDTIYFYDSTTWDVVANSSLPSEFQALFKICEDYFVGVNYDSAVELLNITVINPFTQAVVQNFSTTELNNFQINFAEFKILSFILTSENLVDMLIIQTNTETTIFFNFLNQVQISTVYNRIFSGTSSTFYQCELYDISEYCTQYQVDYDYKNDYQTSKALKIFGLIMVICWVIVFISWRLDSRKMSVLKSAGEVIKID